MKYYIGIDVGTGSVRSGIFNEHGQNFGFITKKIQMWKYQNNFIEQSSDDIWEAVCFCVKEVLQISGVSLSNIRGIGFDATCSLVALDENFKPITVSTTRNNDRNIIVWMDHRAVKETEFINSTKNDLLKYVGGKISLEMQTPKLLWIKNNLPDTWAKAKHFFDLPDYLTFKATGSLDRSICSTVCKWMYMGHINNEDTKKNSIGSWPKSYFEKIGLGELLENNFSKIGKIIRPLGESIGNGISKQSSKEIGLLENTAVGVSAIDAHAGGIGILGAKLGLKNINFENRLALIAGTSSCHMVITEKEKFVDGIWGPYFSALIPEMWLLEGGQSATGSLIDYIISSHPKSNELLELSKNTNFTIYEILNNELEKMSIDLDHIALLTESLHMLPYFHGNRSPRANSDLKGMISGLKLSDTIKSLAILYLATIQAIAYGTKHIIETMKKSGVKINYIFVTGGISKNNLFLVEHSNITGCKIILPKEQESVLLGAAILAASASGDVKSIVNGMNKMNKVGKIIEPENGDVKKYHIKKYKIFLKMYEDQLKYEKIMKKI